MKKILNSIWVQLFLGIVVGVIGITIFYFLTMIFLIKYSGLGFLASGDKSPITFAIVIFFTLLTLAFPTIVWFLLNRFGNLKNVSKKIRIIIFILFVSLPLWAYLGWDTFSTLQIIYKDYRSVRSPCVNKNGVNKMVIGNYTKEFECKNGILNGFTKTYNSAGTLVFEAMYLNGKQDGVENRYYDSGKLEITINYENGVEKGTEVFFNEDGSTSLYIINDQGKSNQIYFQVPEKHLSVEIDLESQNFFCKNQEEYLSKNYNYSCLNNVINGIFIKYDSKGNPLFRIEIVNGILNGVYEQFEYGKLYKHLEFKNGNLDGKVYGYSPEGKLEYGGQYINGLQNGTFIRYDYKGNVESEVVFDNGKIVQINAD
ncbi:MAG: hypothetical protein ISS48_01740 [Candidatus Aenigmarchaeota archaeon]|nr:hypothetical protein [Candidatus Aenigmarchaeota archaeon]